MHLAEAAATPCDADHGGRGGRGGGHCGGGRHSGGGGVWDVRTGGARGVARSIAGVHAAGGGTALRRSVAGQTAVPTGTENRSARLQEDVCAGAVGRCIALVGQGHSISAVDLLFAACDPCIHFRILQLQSLHQTFDARHGDPFRFDGLLVLLRQGVQALVDVHLLRIALTEEVASITPVKSAGLFFHGLLLLVTGDLLVVVFADFLLAELLVRKGCVGGVITGHLLRIEDVVLAAEELRHLAQVVANGGYLGSLIHGTSGCRV